MFALRQVSERQRPGIRFDQTAAALEGELLVADRYRCCRGRAVGDELGCAGDCCERRDNNRESDVPHRPSNAAELYHRYNACTRLMSSADMPGNRAMSARDFNCFRYLVKN